MPSRVLAGVLGHPPVIDEWSVAHVVGVERGHGAYRGRTGNLRLAKAALSQLS